MVNQESEFAIALASAGLTQKQFRDLVERLAGRTYGVTSTSRWAAGVVKPPPCVIALLRLVSLLPPAELAELRRSLPTRS